MHQFQCPHCTQVFQAEQSASELQVACPACQGIASIAAAEAPSTPVPIEPTGTPEELEPQGIAYLYACPLCSTTFQALAEMDGNQVACPSCLGIVTVTIKPTENNNALPEAKESTPESKEETNQPAEQLGSNPVLTEVREFQTPAQGKVVPEQDSGQDKAPEQNSETPPPTPVETASNDSKSDSLIPDEAELPTEVNIHETARTIQVGDRVIELRELLPEEKARRRIRKNLFMIVAGSLILGGVAIYLVNYGLGSQEAPVESSDAASPE